MQQPSTPSPPAVHSANTPQPTPASVSSISQPATPTPQQSAPPQSNQQNPATPNGGATPQQQTSSTQQHVASSPQQFCLRWNNYQSNLTNVFDQLLQSESFVDVTLACDGHSVKAHKMVLSACSPYFQSLFFDNPCQHPIVIMRDIKWPELKAAVEFMYKGEINVSQDQIGPLLKVAESLKIRGLADVNGEPDLSSAELTARPTKISTGNLVDWDSPPSHHHRSSSSHHNMDTLDNHHNHHNMHHHHHHRSKKRRRVSGERSSLSSPAESACTDVLEGPNMPPSSSSVELTSPAPTSTMQTNSGNAGGSITPQLSAQMQVGTSNASAAAAAAAQAALNAAMQGGGNDVGGSMSSLSGLSQMSHHQQPPHPPPQIGHVTDDLEIKPGIAEMIREEERAKLLESSHAWLGASTSSIAASANADFPTLLKLKTPTWNQDQLKEAIEAVVKQKMRFTQASSKYGIPKGTLYDNILGKSKRMAVLEEAGLTLGEENLVLEYCCEVSASPYNRRTKKSLTDVINYVLKLRRQRDPEFLFSGLSGFRWWWAFCKKHSIVSLFYENKDADSYQYQLQSMWQKCWNTNQSLVHNLRFRERGPLKSWRPETMAEAIFSVLKEGLSLSQAARKYDIPYPTFVLYANRVHNMLGPSADGGSDLRPKGRGRPQRILLGVWPDDHIRGVIRAVVFRDSNQIKEESHMGYPRLHDGVSIQPYQTNSSSNGSESTVSPGAAAAAAVAAVAHGLRQQMCSMVAAAQQHAHDTTSPVANLVNSLALAGHCGTVPMPNCGSIPNLPPNVANCAVGGVSSSASSNGGMNQLSLSHMASMRIAASPAGSIHDLRISPANSALESPISSPLGLTVTTQQSGGQQIGPGQHGNSPMDTALNLGMNSSQNPNSALDASIGSGMTYKPSRSYTSPRPDSIFQDDIDELVKPMHHHHHHQSQQQQLLAAAGHLMAQHQSSLNSSAVAARAAALAAATGGVGVNVKDPANAGLVGIKLEPMTTGECRSD